MLDGCDALRLSDEPPNQRGERATRNVEASSFEDRKHGRWPRGKAAESEGLQVAAKLGEVHEPMKPQRATN